MIKHILPEIITKHLSKYSYSDIYEIRLRRNCPVVINHKGRNVVLTNTLNEKIFVDNSVIDYVLKHATEYSLYAFNNQIKQGYITARGGIRLGIAGESVTSDNFMPTTIKNINSINIRIPHEVIGAAKVAFKYIYSRECGVKNTLIISPPGAGKTTFLRDIARDLSSVEQVINTLIVDERFEIASVMNGEAMLDVGCYSDIVSGASKMFAFTNGIRALKPDVIITDELMGESDVDACKRAINSGVKVIASAHASNHIELLNKEEFKALFSGKVFDRYIILSQKTGPGQIEQILDENFKSLYF